jgi:hypothetical protein
MPDTINQEEIRMLRSEVEILMKERHALLKVTGAAAGLVAELDSRELPHRTAEAAELLAASINELPEESLQDALSAVKAAIIA